MDHSKINRRSLVRLRTSNIVSHARHMQEVSIARSGAPREPTKAELRKQAEQAILSFKKPKRVRLRLIDWDDK